MSSTLYFCFTMFWGFVDKLNITGFINKKYSEFWLKFKKTDDLKYVTTCRNS